MPKIILRFKDVIIRDYPVAAGQTLTIGRKHSNDIVIDSLAVSGNHARIEPLATTFVLRDLGSTNGTFVNEQKIAIHNLQHDDIIFIGNHTLAFDYSDRVRAASNVHDDYDVDKTRIINTSAYHDLRAKSVAVSQTSDPRSNSDSQMKQEPAPSFFTRLLKKIFG
jgi:pSer/pThr/pTyr-binding forkhead associated (FHA) protein